MRNHRKAGLAAVFAAALIHGWVVWTILRQPLDAHVPPETPRTPVWALYFDAVMSPGPGADFFAVYHAGIQAARGQTPYGRDESPQVTPYFYIFRYHPIVASTLGRVVTIFDPARAYRLWVLLVEAVFVAFAVAIARHPLSPWTRAVAALVMLLQFPYFLELHMGQFTFLPAAVTALTVLWLHRRLTTPGRALAACGPIAVVSVLKPFPLLAVAGLTLNRTGRLVAITAIVVTALLLSPLFTSTELFHEYAALNFVDDTVHLYPGNFSLIYQVFATSVFSGAPFSPRTVAIVSTVGSLAIAGLVFVALVRSGTRDVRGATGTLMAAFFLAYFRVWEHHYTAVIVGGLLILVSVTPDEHGKERGVVGTLLVGLALLAAPSLFSLLPADPSTWTPAQHYLLAWPKIMGAACVVLAVVSSRKTA